MEKLEKLSGLDTFTSKFSKPESTSLIDRSELQHKHVLKFGNKAVTKKEITDLTSNRQLSRIRQRFSEYQQSFRDADEQLT